ncbi:MAG: hypothetical protein V3T35_07285, partial [Spirochaetia bacterium]
MSNGITIHLLSHAVPCPRKAFSAELPGADTSPGSSSSGCSARRAVRRSQAGFAQTRHTTEEVFHSPGDTGELIV